MSAALLLVCGPFGAWRVLRRAALLRISNPCWHADTALRIALIDCGFRG